VLILLKLSSSYNLVQVSPLFTFIILYIFDYYYILVFNYFFSVITVEFLIIFKPKNQPVPVFVDMFFINS